MAARIGVMARKPAATGCAGESALGRIGEGSTIWTSLSHGREVASASQRVLKKRELRPQHAVGTALEPAIRKDQIRAEAEEPAGERGVDDGGQEE